MTAPLSLHPAGRRGRALPRRVRTASWLLAQPADWWLACRLLACAAVVSPLVRVMPLPKLAWLLRRSGRIRPVSEARDHKALAWVRWLYGAERRCLDRAFVLACVLAGTHRDLELVVGMRKADGTWGGHAWVLLGGRPFGENAAALAQFEAVFVITADGIARPASDSLRH